jgi:hypothetical protein
MHSAHNVRSVLGFKCSGVWTNRDSQYEGKVERKGKEGKNEKTFTNIRKVRKK